MFVRDSRRRVIPRLVCSPRPRLAATPEEAALNYARRIGREEAGSQAAQAAAALARTRVYKA